MNRDNLRKCKETYLDQIYYFHEFGANQYGTLFAVVETEDGVIKKIHAENNIQFIS